MKYSWQDKENYQENFGIYLQFLPMIRLKITNYKIKEQVYILFVFLT